MQMGRGSPRYVHWRQAEADDPAGAGLWREGDGTDSCGVDAEYVISLSLSFPLFLSFGYGLFDGVGGRGGRLGVSRGRWQR